MKVEKIVDKDLILALIIKNQDFDPGLNFVSSDEDFQQVGLWNYNKGRQLPAHIHLPAKREVLKTQEVIFVKKGSLVADIFSAEGQLIRSVDLSAGDLAIFLNGGHGYEITEDNTQVLEVKNGPYPGPEKDRKRI